MHTVTDPKLLNSIRESVLNLNLWIPGQVHKLQTSFRSQHIFFKTDHNHNDSKKR